MYTYLFEPDDYDLCILYNLSLHVGIYIQSYLKIYFLNVYRIYVVWSRTVFFYMWIIDRMQILDYVADILYRSSDGFCQENARFVILRHIKHIRFWSFSIYAIEWYRNTCNISHAIVRKTWNYKRTICFRAIFKHLKLI